MLTALIKRVIADTNGATAIEYGLIASLIVIGLMAALQNFADSTIETWEYVSDEVTQASNN